MNKSLRSIVKEAALRTIPNSSRMRYLASKPLLEAWKATRLVGVPTFQNREKMYDFLNAKLLSSCPIDYLEFGVYKGESIKYFSRINTSPSSRFFGFDTFTGLPSDWDDFGRRLKKATFDTGGNTPESDDPRLLFVKGLFQETLPSFLREFSQRNQLVIHNDSDLYSATLYVLTIANAIIKPGTLVIFDEFYSVLHEFKALEDYCDAYLREYEVVAITGDCLQVAIRMK